MKRALISLMPLPVLALAPVLSMAVAPAPALAKGAELPDQFELGRNAAGNPCLATRNWNDAAAIDPFATSYSFTCRGAAANRYIGVVRVVRPERIAAVDALLACGADLAVSIPGLPGARARRCNDKTLGQETVETRFAANGRIYSASALRVAQGPAEEGLRILLGRAASNQDRGRSLTVAVDANALAAAPEGAVASDGAVANADASLLQGLRLVRQGLNLEAARVVGDALGRLPEGAAPATRIDLLMLAGLIDSNLRFFGSADGYFTRADALLAANPGIEGASLLASKRRSYAALHLLNQRAFKIAAGALETGGAGGLDPSQPLLDAATLRGINRRPLEPGRSQLGLLAGSASEAELSGLVIDAQAAWARSVALLGEGRTAEASTMLAQADRIYAALRGEQIRQQQLLWLGARIERQRARLQLRQGDRPGALQSLDNAIDLLRQAQIAGDGGPSLAQAQLERASVLAANGGEREKAFAQFDEAVGSLLAADSDSVQLPAQATGYLDALVVDASSASAGSALAPDRFFRALQAAGSPAIARQFVELQSVIATNPALAPKVQDREEVENQINALRYELSSSTDLTPERRAALEARRKTLEDHSLALQNELTADGSYVQVTDTPATIAEVRAVLEPNEGYLKLSQVGPMVYGILIDGQGATIYRVGRSAKAVSQLVGAVRGSISRSGGTKLPVFSVSGANAIYKLLAGPVGGRLPGYASLVVDASGVLDVLPPEVLVSDDASAAAYARGRQADPYDYTKVGFLARQTSLQVALSPRSLIVSRHHPESAAPYPFIGFAQHEPAPLSATVGNQMISIGTACEVERRTVAEFTRMLKPIDARELTEVGRALGLSQVPEMIGAEFTDTALRARTDLNQFQVLHFATHGLTEGQWACAKAPPGLVTSLGGAGSDAMLSYDEAARLPLDANLVVLSACDTSASLTPEAARAAGLERVGASLDGLVRAFLAAHARAVLSTYWPISDEGESEALLTDFYRFARTDSIGDALRKAQLGLIARHDTSHPYYWAPFVLVGDARKPLLTGKARLALETGATGPATVKAAP